MLNAGAPLLSIETALHMETPHRESGHWKRLLGPWVSRRGTSKSQEEELKPFMVPRAVGGGLRTPEHT